MMFLLIKKSKNRFVGDRILQCILRGNRTCDRRSFRIKRGKYHNGLMKDAFHYYQHGYNICGNEAGKNVALYFSGRSKKERVVKGG